VADDRDKRRSYHTPASGVPARIDQADELSVPVLVESPALSRRRTDSDPPRMTAQELARDTTLRRKQLEREVAMLAARVNAVSDRVAELQEARSVHEVHLTTVRESLGEFETIAEFREVVVTRLADGFGKDGTNGKFGALKARVDQSEARRWWGITFLLGLMLSAGGVVFWAGSTVAELKNEQRNLREHIDRLHAGAEPRRPASD